jgi:archaellum component FlaC
MILIDSAEWNKMVNKINSLGVKVDTLLAQSKPVDMTRLEELMADTHKSLDDIISDIQELKTREEGLIELVSGVRQQIDALGLPPDQQAKVDAIFDAVEERKQAIQNAIDANTPPPTTPPPTDPNAPQVNPL